MQYIMFIFAFLYLIFVCTHVCYYYINSFSIKIYVYIGADVKIIYMSRDYSLPPSITDGIDITVLLKNICEKA